MENNFIVKEDMICPITNNHCEDECCTVGSICNLRDIESGKILAAMDVSDSGILTGKQKYSDIQRQRAKNN
jgi:hypothetical protein